MASLTAMNAMYTRVQVEGSSNTYTDIGGMVNISVTANKDIRRLYEIGSKKPYIGEGFITVGLTASKMVLVVDSNQVYDLLSALGFSNNAFDWLNASLDQAKNLRILFYTDTDGNNSFGLDVENAVVTGISISLTAGDIIVVENITFEAKNVTTAAVSTS